MDLIVDTNIVAAAIVKPGITRNLLFNSTLTLHSPEYLYKELKEHEAEFRKKSALGQPAYDSVVLVLRSNIGEFAHSSYSDLESVARNSSPDQADWPFIALALKLGCPIWSNDKRLKRQDLCRIVSTEELLEILK